MPYSPPPDEIPLGNPSYNLTVMIDTGDPNMGYIQLDMPLSPIGASGDLDGLLQQLVDVFAAFPGVTQVSGYKSVSGGYGQECTPTPAE